MNAGAFDDGHGAGIAYCEPLAGDAAEIAFTADRSIEHGVSDDNRSLRDNTGIGRGPDNNATAGETLADIVVALALELERDAFGKPGAEALAGSADKLHMDRVVGQASMAVTLSDFARQHGTGGAIGVPDGCDDAHRCAAVERGLRLGDQFAVENAMNL